MDMSLYDILAHLLLVSVLYFLHDLYDEHHIFKWLGDIVRLRGSALILRSVSLIFILAASVFLVYQLVQYSMSRANYPSDMTIAGVPVGGLDPQSAAQRLQQVYSVPVEIHYLDAVIDLEPGLVGFKI